MCKIFHVFLMTIAMIIKSRHVGRSAVAEIQEKTFTFVQLGSASPRRLETSVDFPIPAKLQVFPPPFCSFSM